MARGPAAAGGGADDREAGFVLLSVLLAVALFMTAAASFAVKSRLSALQAANRVEQAKARALTDGAVLLVVDALSAARPAPAARLAGLADADAPRGQRRPRPLRPDGTPLSCALSDGRTLELSSTDQGGAIDLNAAPPEMIAAFLFATGLDGETARRIAGAIADFRDENDVPEAGGASEAALYREAGKPFGPRNGPFLDAAEIAQLPALTPDLARRLEPLFTVFNARPAIDVSVMDRRARALLPREIRGLTELAAWQDASEGTAFSVEAVLRRADGTAAAARHGLVTFADMGSARDPGEALRPPSPRLLQWREILVPPQAPGTPPAASPLCERLSRALDAEPTRRAAEGG